MVLSEKFIITKLRTRCCYEAHKNLTFWRERNYNATHNVSTCYLGVFCLRISRCSTTPKGFILCNSRKITTTTKEEVIHEIFRKLQRCAELHTLAVTTTKRTCRIECSGLAFRGARTHEGLDRKVEDGVKKTRCKVSLSFWDDVSRGNTWQKRRASEAACAVMRQIIISLDTKERGRMVGFGRTEGETDSELQ